MGGIIEIKHIIEDGVDKGLIEYTTKCPVCGNLVDIRIKIKEKKKKPKWWEWW